MSRYKAYPEYRDSGVEWLGEIPSHWSISKLRYGFSFGKGLSITKENLVDEGVPCVSYGEVHSKYGFEVDPGRHILKCVEESYLQSSSESLIKNGDFVFADTSEDIEGSGNFTQLRSELITFAGYHTIIVRPIDRENPRYFAYLFDSPPFRSQIRLAVKGVKVFSITQAILRAADIWLPFRGEQEKIAAFLDHETAKIDALIEKQQRLIELLKEKRQAVTSRAVTKGLNPNVPMKDSGVEWLGEVPAHWVVAPLKRFAEVIDCKHYTVQFLDEGLPIVSIRELNEDSIDLANAKMTSRAEWDFLREGRIPRAGDIVFCRNASVGAAGYVDDDSEFCMGQDVCLIRTGKANRYMHFQITSRHVREQIEAFLVGATIRRANVEEIRRLVVAQPPEVEQISIAKYLENTLSEFDALSDKANRTVELLQERRTALISAAVTGKIDVRDWQPVAEQDRDMTCCSNLS